MEPGHRAGCPSLAGSVSSYAHIQLVLSQVSHHPPSAAHHVFSKHGWSLWQEITIASKFRGKYISIMPLGELGPGVPNIWLQKEGFVHLKASCGPQGRLHCPLIS